MFVNCSVLVQLNSLYILVSLMDRIPTILRPFISFSVISGQWTDDNGRMCAKEPRLKLKRIPSQAGFQPGTARSVGQCLTQIWCHVSIIQFSVAVPFKTIYIQVHVSTFSS